MGFLCKQNVRWKNLSRIKDWLFQRVEIFIIAFVILTAKSETSCATYIRKGYEVNPKFTTLSEK